jgi:pyridoxamine 5'-phosphate oxidase family protein
MSGFTDNEVAYLQSQRLGRLATVGADGTPHAVPVGFRLDAATGAIEIGGRNLAASKKFRDLRDRPRAAFVVDDLQTTDPWRPRGLEIRGGAETFEQGGERFGEGWDAAWIRVVPERIVAWGLDADPFAGANSRTVQPPAGGR